MPARRSFRDVACHETVAAEACLSDGPRVRPHSTGGDAMESSRRPGGRQVPLPRRVVVAAVMAATTLVGTVGRAAAQPVDGDPDPSGMPGAALVSQLINWLMWASLMASLGAVLYGAALWRGGAKVGNSAR